ncbi:exonuclease domain-containing protein [Leeuwenhoekiella sp. W20_SRS_FM14]|uniref:exonuclease domain-containing protein n=1 Tax=Leeuwenhoekiella sp. W20_SRS_FM14 TaxID=3240270 RepID=UPI003F9C5579
MEEAKFAIIDVETTGGGIKDNKITEICIIVLQNGIEIDRFVSLINPQREIPLYIEKLTGINDAMVADAPTFDTVAPAINILTKDCIFVAHNVGFDYNVVRAEFSAAGIDFNRKRICTVRLAKKLIPGLFSYSLGNLCTSINIPHRDRHRAQGDTEATVLLFQRCIELDPEYEVIKGFLNRKSKESFLPPHFKSADFEELPTNAGVYFFKDKKGTPLYIGKAINIQKRVLSHFREKSNRKYALLQDTHSIDFERTGSELLALLREAELILKHYPKYNKAQKNPSKPYKLTSYPNKKGIQQFALHKNKIAPVSLMQFYTYEEAIFFLELVCETFNLCPKYCGLQQGVDTCNHYKLQTCSGVCRAKIEIKTYNKRVAEALEFINTYEDSCLLLDEGRIPGEKSFIYLNQGKYSGYGFIDAQLPVNKAEDFTPYLVPQKSSGYADRIIRRHLTTTPKIEKIILNEEDTFTQDIFERWVS